MNEASFNAKMRVGMGEARAIAKKVAKDKRLGRGGGSGKSNKWKHESSAFRDAMKANRMIAHWLYFGVAALD